MMNNFISIIKLAKQNHLSINRLFHFVHALIQEILSLTGHKYTLEFGRKKAYVTRLSNHKVFMIW
jgi:hypothetical protein